MVEQDHPKLCPMRIPKDGTIFSACLREKCAWFDGNDCAVKSLAILYKLQRP